MERAASAQGVRSGQPLRVCILSTYDLSTPGGGVKQHVMHLAASLRQRGDQVTVAGPATSPVDLPDVHSFGGVVNIRSNGADNPLGLLTSPRTVARYFREHPFDVIHVHEPLNPALAWWVVRATPGVAHVATFHAYAEAESPLLRWVRKTVGPPLLASYQRAIAVSEPAARHAACAWRRPLTIIPNGVPSRLFTPSEPRTSLPVRLLFVGRLGERRKGVRFLYDAYRGLLARNLPVTLDIVGELAGAPPPPDLPGLTWHGPVGLEALTGFYRNCDVFVSPATGQESFGIVLLEAMASGKVIVCSAIDGYRQVVIPEGAWLVPPADARALEDQLAEVIQLDPQARLHKGELNRRAAEGYDWDKLAERIRAEYLAAISIALGVGALDS